MKYAKHLPQNIIFHRLVDEKVNWEDFEITDFIRFVSSIGGPSYCLSNYILSFDDGHLTDLLASSYIRKFKNIAMQSFIVTNNIGKSNFLDAESVYKLHCDGVSIGSHTVSHPNLKFCSRSELMNELSQSKRILEEIIGASVVSLSVPYGSYNLNVLECASDCGYTDVYTSSPYLFRTKVSGINVHERLSVAHLKRSGLMPSLQYDQIKLTQLVSFYVTVGLKQGAKRFMPNKIYQRIRDYMK